MDRSVLAEGSAMADLAALLFKAPFSGIKDRITAKRVRQGGVEPAPRLAHDSKIRQCSIGVSSLAHTLRVNRFESEVGGLIPEAKGSRLERKAFPCRPVLGEKSLCCPTRLN